MEKSMFSKLALTSAIAVATFATNSARASTIQATFETEVFAPATSFGLGWTYSYTNAAFNEATYSNATARTSYDSSWLIANNQYVAYPASPTSIVYGTAHVTQDGQILPPDNGLAFIARWTSDVIAPSVTLAGTFQKLSSFSNASVGNSEVWLSINGATPISMASVASTNTTLQNFSYAPVTPTPIALGDTIELITVARGQNWVGDLRLNASISTIPEPSAALLGGLGMLAMLRRRR